MPHTAARAGAMRPDGRGKPEKLKKFLMIVVVAMGSQQITENPLMIAGFGREVGVRRAWVEATGAAAPYWRNTGAGEPSEQDGAR